VQVNGAQDVPGEGGEGPERRASSAAGADDHSRRASVVPVAITDITRNRRASAYNPDEYERRISLVAEQAQVSSHLSLK
jgi:hypothetical protein